MNKLKCMTIRDEIYKLNETVLKRILIKTGKGSSFEILKTSREELILARLLTVIKEMLFENSKKRSKNNVRRNRRIS